MKRCILPITLAFQIALLCPGKILFEATSYQIKALGKESDHGWAQEGGLGQEGGAIPFPWVFPGESVDSINRFY